MHAQQWPAGPRIHLANVHVPAPLLDAPAMPPANGDGVVRVDLLIEDDRIADVLMPGSVTGAPRYDADGGQAWPTFADLHTHLDKGQNWARAPNVDGTLEMARSQTRVDTLARWSAADVEQRFEFSLRCAYAHGTSAIRTHIDCFVPAQAPISFAVFRRLRDRWAGRIELQAVALTSTELYDNPDNAALVDLIAESGGRLGGVTFRLTEEESPSITGERLIRLFELAGARGLDVDLHVDENGKPSSRTLSQVAEAVMRTNFRGQVVCGHCCSLSMQSDADAVRTMRLAHDAGLTIVSLPLVNQFLQGRLPQATPRWRGIPLLAELRSAGAKVALGSDNCRDPYHAFGDLDLLEVFGGAVRMGHLDTQMAAWSAAVTRTPATTIAGRDAGVLRRGAKADFVLFRGRTFSELLARRQSDRIVIRNGRPIDTTLPDYRELDALMPPP